MTKEYTVIDRIGKPFSGRLVTVDTHTQYYDEIGLPDMTDGYTTERFWIPESVDIDDDAAVYEQVKADLIEQFNAIFED